MKTLYGIVTFPLVFPLTGILTACARILLMHIGRAIERSALWLIFNVYLGRLAPWIFALALGRWPKRKEDD